VAVNRAIFLDKDGTLIENVPHNVDPELVRLAPGAVEGLGIAIHAGFSLIVVTNQPGIGRGLFAPESLGPVWEKINALLGAKSTISRFYYCPHIPESGCACRKPRTGLFERAASDLGVDMRRSWMIGDILDDVEAGNRVGCRTVLIDNGNETEWRLNPLRIPAYCAPNLLEACRFAAGR
jgi:D-glycero-D-manno-heptose 1,7-bisphosphate phosphatase